MKASECVQLENDRSFKYGYLKATRWWKSILLLPPVCLLFIGLVGVIWLLNIDKLASWYVIPYLVLFVLGTIWLKAIKKYIQKQLLSKDGAFLVCQAQVAGEKDGYIYTVYSTGEKRHNEHYIKAVAERLTIADIPANELQASKKRAIILHDEETDTDFCFRTYFHQNISKRNAAWRDESGFPLLYIDDSHVELIKKRDLNIYLNGQKKKK